MKHTLKTALLIVGVVAALLWVAEFVGAGPLKRPTQPSEVPTVVSYQGQVTLNGNSYDGTGYFKFAIVDLAGTTSHWSNDGTSVGGGEPDDATPLTVAGGLFNVLLGDPALSHMTEPLESSVFDGADRYLRVWFSTDDASFSQLTPDRRISAVPYALRAVVAGDADTLDGQHGSHYQDASNLISGTLATGRFSAYGDLGAEGRLDNDDGNDLLTRSQADSRFNGPISASATLYTVLIDNSETWEETTLLPLGDSFCFLTRVSFAGINRDHLAECEVRQSSSDWMLYGQHTSDSDAYVTCSARCVSW